MENHSERLPMGPALVLMGIMWLILVGTTIWAYTQVSHAPSGAASPAVQMVYDPEGITRFLQKLQWFGLASVGCIALLTLVGLARGEGRKKE